MMNKTCGKILAFFFICCLYCLYLSTGIPAQGASPGTPDTACLGHPVNIGPMEKLLVWTDRDLYLEGDTIWLKIINTDLSSGKAMELSSTAYVELIGPGERRLSRQKISLAEEGGRGWISIPRNILSGNYYLRTYTSWMRNFYPAGYTYTLVSVINPFISLHFSQYEAGGDSCGGTDLSIFPEQGHLISGLENRVFFKLSGMTSNADSLRGEVRDERDSLVARLNFFDGASGFFSFMPCDTMDYHLSVSFGSFEETWPVPPAQNEGYTMDWTENPDFLTLHIKRYPFSADEDRSLMLTVRASGRVLFSLPVDLENGAAEIVIDSDDLRGFTNEFSLTDMEGNILCSRIIHKQAGEDLSIEIGPEKGPFRCRENVPVSIRVTDAYGSPAMADLCVSVYLIDTPDSGKENDACEMQVVDPVFFAQWWEMHGQGVGMDSETMGAALSAGHLIHADLNPGREEPFPPAQFYPELAGPAISGRILERITGRPAANSLVICSSVGSASQFQVFRTGEDGKFRFAMAGDTEHNDLVFRASGLEIPLDIRVDNPYSEQHLHLVLPPLYLDESRASYIEQLSINRQVREAYRSPDESPVPATVPDRPSFFYGLPSETVKLEDFIQLPVMEEIFREIVRSVIVYRKAGMLKLGVIDHATREIIGEHPLFLIDGVPIFDHDRILGLDPALLRIIHVVDAKYFLGELEMDGIIDIRSEQGRFRDFDLPAATVTCPFQVYAGNNKIPARSEQSAEKPSGGQLPDFRSLLYWNPDITTDRDGKAEVTVHAGDVPGKYKMVVHAISEEGTIGGSTEVLEITCGD